MSPTRRTLLLSALLVLFSALAWLAMVGPAWTQANRLSLQVGDVAPVDILAPADVTYTSEVLTEQAREQAAAQVAPIYSPPDANITRQQMARLRQTLDFITSVRADAYATTEQKLADLAALQDLRLRRDTAEAILALSDEQWQTVQQECVNVLVQVMRGVIREDRLEEARRSVPALVSLSLPEDQAAIVTEITQAFVAPNSLRDEERTQAARQAAREAVQPVEQTYRSGETIVQRGQVLGPQEIEALTELHLIEPQRRWQDTVGSIALVLALAALIAIYLWQKPHLRRELTDLVFIGGLFLGFLWAGRLLIVGHAVLPYAFPMAAFALVLAAFFDAQTAVAFTIPLAALLTYELPQGWNLTMDYLLGAAIGALLVRRDQRLLTYLWAGTAIALTGVLVTLAYRLEDPVLDLGGVLMLTGAALFNGLASVSVGLLLQVLTARPLRRITFFHLAELARPDHPLLKHLLRQAPGTYQHSLQVANLAEQAAEAIGANASLTRIGAQYHDVGKAENPHFYIENQVPGSPNPHDALSPEESARIIIRHVTDGVALARKYRLPAKIVDFITEHHGTMLTRYQYVRAVKAAGGDESRVNPDLFRYPGPRPRSRETAILMLADGCEARVRAQQPKSEEELRQIILDTIRNRLAEGQLDDSGLTMRDLNRIAESFTITLRGMYHPRIEYPKLPPKPEEAPPLAEPAPAEPQTEPEPTS